MVGQKRRCGDHSGTTADGVCVAGTPAQAIDSARPYAPLYDPEPPRAPDYGFTCKILERYGNADIDVWRAKSITSTHGPG